jgi:hypothetical protein
MRIHLGTLHNFSFDYPSASLLSIARSCPYHQTLSCQIWLTTTWLSDSCSLSHRKREKLDLRAPGRYRPPSHAVGDSDFRILQKKSIYFMLISPQSNSRSVYKWFWRENPSPDPFSLPSRPSPAASLPASRSTRQPPASSCTLRPLGAPWRGASLVLHPAGRLELQPRRPRAALRRGASSCNPPTAGLLELHPPAAGLELQLLAPSFTPTRRPASISGPTSLALICWIRAYRDQIPLELGTNSIDLHTFTWIRCCLYGSGVVCMVPLKLDVCYLTYSSVGSL